MLDVALTSTDEEIAKLIESGFLNVNFFVIQEKSVVCICCKDTIVFCYDCSSKSDLAKTCGDVIEPITCFDLIPYGFENVCLLCNELVLKYFLNFLVEVKK